MPGGQLITKGETELAACLAVFAAAPRAEALLCDFDGTISPVVAHPGEAAVSQPFLEVLAALTEMLGLVVFATGRSLEDGRRMIHLDGAACVGTHGLELMTPGGQTLTEPQAERYITEIEKAAEAAARDLDCGARRSACDLAAVPAETPRPVIEDADVLVRATPGVDEVLTRLPAAVEG